MNFKDWLLLGIIILSINVVSAAPSDYTVSLKVLPDVILANNEILISGYVTLSDWTKLMNSGNFTMSIYRNSDLVYNYDISSISYFNDLGRSDLLLDGFFYKKLTLTTGDYSVLVKIGGVTKAYEYFNVQPGKSNLTLRLIDVAQSTNTISPILNINNSQASGNVDIRFYGRSNFDSPQVLTGIYVSTGSLYTLPKDLGTFDSSLFSDPSKVYGLIVMANGSPGYTNPSVQVLNVQSGVANSGDLSASINSIKLNNNTEFTLSVNNNGLIKTAYSLTASGSLAPYVQFSPNSVDINSGESSSVRLSILVPKNYTGASDLRINLLSNGLIVDEQLFNPVLIPADPEHKVTIASINFNKQSYLIGESITGSFNLINNGDYTESFWVEHSVGSQTSKEWVTLAKGASRSISFSSEGLSNQGQVSLNILVYNNDLSSQNAASVQVNDKTYSFSTSLDKHQVTSNNTASEKVKLTIINTGNVVDKYSITSSYSGVSFSSRLVVIEPGKSSVITATIKSPDQFDLLDITFSVCSQWSDDGYCDGQSLLMYVFKEGSSSPSESGVTVIDSDITARSNEGAIFSIKIENNDLVTNDYSVSFEGDFANSITTYPEGGFSIVPGGEKTVLVYVSPMTTGSYTTDYTVYENDNELSTGKLKLTISGSVFELTGFSIATGSVLGLVGLVMLSVFIYFYFLRHSPKKKGGFKSLDVKKADLGKPKSKDANQYW